MKKITTFVFITCIVLTGLSGCTDNTNSSYPGISTSVHKISIKEVLDNPHAYAYDYVQLTGSINQTVDIPGYTLWEMSDGTGSIWVAGSSQDIEQGSRITATGNLNTDFYSSTLDKTFSVLLIASWISDENASSPSLYPPHGMDGQVLTNITVPAIEGGTRIEDILNDTTGFDGKEVKVAANVLTNVVLIDYCMLTIDDGTGQLKAKAPNSFVFSKGENIVVSGTISTDVDIGSGYHYDILLEITDKE